MTLQQGAHLGVGQQLGRHLQLLQLVADVLRQPLQRAPALPRPFHVALLSPIQTVKYMHDTYDAWQIDTHSFSSRQQHELEAMQGWPRGTCGCASCCRYCDTGDGPKVADTLMEPPQPVHMHRGLMFGS